MVCFAAFVKTTESISNIQFKDRYMTASAGSFWIFEQTELGRMIHITLEKTVIGHDSWPAPLESQPEPPADATVTHRTFFDMDVDGEPIGRLVFGLFGNALPKTVENFRALCAGDKVCCRQLLLEGLHLYSSQTCKLQIAPAFALIVLRHKYLSPKMAVIVIGEACLPEQMQIHYNCIVLNLQTQQVHVS